MACKRELVRLIGGCAVSFGVGVVFTCFLPSVVMLLITSAAVLVVGIGIFILFK